MSFFFFSRTWCVGEHPTYIESIEMKVVVEKNLADIEDSHLNMGERVTSIMMIRAKYQNTGLTTTNVKSKVLQNCDSLLIRMAWCSPISLNSTSSSVQTAMWSKPSWKGLLVESYICSIKFWFLVTPHKRVSSGSWRVSVFTNPNFWLPNFHKHNHPLCIMCFKVIVWN